jgi:hypothetical protein
MGLTGAHPDKISQFPVIGERNPFAGFVTDRKTQRIVAFNPMWAANFWRLSGGDQTVETLKFCIHVVTL